MRALLVLLALATFNAHAQDVGSTVGVIDSLTASLGQLGPLMLKILAIMLALNWIKQTIKGKTEQRQSAARAQRAQERREARKAEKAAAAQAAAAKTAAAEAFDRAAAEPKHFGPSGEKLVRPARREGDRIYFNPTAVHVESDRERDKRLWKENDLDEMLHERGKTRDEAADEMIRESRR